MKTEPSEYSIDTLKKDKKTLWEGVRNYQARNFIRDAMKRGDGVLIYHSSTKEPGVYGVGVVSAEAVPDLSQFDRQSGYCDPTAKKEAPRWYSVEVSFTRKFTHPAPLSRLREAKNLQGMLLLRKGQRLSVQPVSEAHFNAVCRLAGAKSGK